jgi:hypothetical protein
MDLGQQVEQRLVHGLSRHPPVPESPGTHAPRFSCRVGGRRRGGRAGSGIRDWGLGPGRLEQGSHGRRQAAGGRRGGFSRSRLYFLGAIHNATTADPALQAAARVFVSLAVAARGRFRAVLVQLFF